MKENPVGRSGEDQSGKRESGKAKTSIKRVRIVSPPINGWIGLSAFGMIASFPPGRFL
jgi:hypothetical protein